MYNAEQERTLGSELVRSCHVTTTTTVIVKKTNANIQKMYKQKKEKKCQGKFFFYVWALIRRKKENFDLVQGNKRRRGDGGVKW